MDPHTQKLSTKPLNNMLNHGRHYTMVFQTYLILYSKGILKEKSIAPQKLVWVLTVKLWETPTIYSKNANNNENLFNDIVAAKWTNGWEYITGYANSNEFLSRLTNPEDHPHVAIDMTHSTGTGAWV